MKITDAFLGEHGVFYAQFDHFEQRMASGDLECVQRQATLLAHALEPHAHLENELLFAPMEERIGASPVLAVMRREHDDIEEALREIQATSDVERARELLADMIREARDHFQKEEHIAFPLAEEALGEAVLLELGAAWARRRGVHVAGHGPSAPMPYGA